MQRPITSRRGRRARRGMQKPGALPVMPVEGRERRREGGREGGREGKAGSGGDTLPSLPPVFSPFPSSLSSRR